MRTSLLAFAVATTLWLPGTMMADTFTFSASALGMTTSGALTATSNPDGSYQVTDIMGTNITGLIAAGDPFFGNDNLLFPTNPRTVDVNGLAFTEDIGGQSYSVDLYSTVSGFQVLALDSLGNLDFDTATLAVSNAATVTPEPSSLLLLGTGLLGAGVAAFRRRLA